MSYTWWWELGQLSPPIRARLFPATLGAPPDASAAAAPMSSRPARPEPVFAEHGLFEEPVSRRVGARNAHLRPVFVLETSVLNKIPCSQTPVRHETRPRAPRQEPARSAAFACLGPLGPLDLSGSQPTAVPQPAGQAALCLPLLSEWLNCAHSSLLI